MNRNIPKYCGNCGVYLENLNSKENNKCPKCGIEFQPVEPIRNPSTPATSIVEQLPYKSPGTAALIAFIGGLFGLLGVGHIYVGKIGKGIGILITGFVIAFLLIIMVVFLQGIFFFEVDESSSAGVAIIMFTFGIVYLVLWIWQIFNARKMARKFNESVRTTGKEPW
jgi:TM2 domain-containing membrane protein YozV/predicted RNA-binding Zn-ribbon protein involved in translation (DUF1610 family)